MRCQSCNELLDFGDAKFCPACGATVSEPPPDPLIGQLVAGRYRVTHLVAEGGMGRVYAAEQTLGRTVRKVAIKVLLSEYSDQEKDMLRFQRECSTVAELEHPNTIKFFDYGETPSGELFIAMEFLSGKSLAQIVSEGPLPPDRADLIIGQICGSLQEAHDHGIVHRDLKPDNVVITSPGGTPDFVKVLDFGIAKRVGGRDMKLTPLGVVLGSPPYMSPEQFTLQDVDARSDIYSLAVLSYQLLTGHLPFDARDPLEWAALHMTAMPDAITSPHVPAQMKGAITRALAKNPQERPASMREFFVEFTTGGGSVPPGRVSSVLPRSPSEIPFPPPPRAPQITTQVDYEDTSSGARTHQSSAPELSFRETGLSLPVGEAEGRLTSQGTLMLEPGQKSARAKVASPGPPRRRITMPDLLPPTVREPEGLAELAPGGGQKKLLFAAVGLVLLGFVIGGIVWLSYLSNTGSSSKPKAASASARAGLDAPPVPIDISRLPPEIRSDPLVASAAQSAATPPDERSSPCQTAVYGAVTGRCDLAKRSFSRCAANDVHHASAKRTVEGLCPP